MNEYTLNQIILLQENFSQPALPTRIIFQVELIKAVESVFVGMNI